MLNETFHLAELIYLVVELLLRTIVNLIEYPMDLDS